MARERLHGTPPERRAATYLFPRRSGALVRWSFPAAGVVAAALIALYFAGARRTLSPGDVSSPHARIDLQCVQCHDEGSAVAAVRCERCHDPVGSGRVTHSAHVLLGTGDPLLAEEQAREQPCQTCHVEHRGRAADLRAVDDRECASCHQFRSLAAHPEFAVVRAQATAGVGINFDHDRHLLEAQKKVGATCQLCHEQTPDRRGFQPITFDRHCASCHTSDGALTGETDPVDPALLVPPDALSAEARGPTVPEIRTNARGRQFAVGLRHRDAWVLYNALRLRRGIDREGEDAERLTLQSRISYLEQLLRARPPATLSPEVLGAAAEALAREIASLDVRVAQPDAGDDAAALEQLAATTRTLARQLEGIDAAADPDLRALAAESLSAAAPPPDGGGGDAASALERRKAELLRLLDAIAVRVGDGNLRNRVEALRAEVEGLEPSGGSDADRAPLLARLNALEAAFRSIRGIPDTGVQGELARIDLLRQYGRQRIAAGLTPTDFETRRRELLALVDAVEMRAGDALRLRAGWLRQRVLALRPGSSGDAELRRVRQQYQRQLDRLRFEQELAQQAEDSEPAPSQDAGLDRAGIEALLQGLRADLAALERAPRMPVAADVDERTARKDALDALLGACLKCHEYDPSGARLAPVRIAEPVMPRSIFNHAPHTTQTTCETCHGGMASPPDEGPRETRGAADIWRSKLATDVNVPGVTLCATCHGTTRARADCETCHVYHPPSLARLARLYP